tara:strand:+ start:3800 stop:4654 length:855 start_codon:yes stop_codon:yes gene_type:complete
MKNWIKLLSDTSKDIPASELKEYLEEVLCYFKKFPQSVAFQDALNEEDSENDIWAQIGLLEYQISAGMQNYMELRNNSYKWLKDKGVMMTDVEAQREFRTHREKAHRIKKRTWLSKDLRKMETAYVKDSESILINAFEMGGIYAGKTKDEKQQMLADNREWAKERLSKIAQQTLSERTMPSGFYLVTLYKMEERFKEAELAEQIMGLKIHTLILMYYSNEDVQRLQTTLKITPNNQYKFTNNFKILDFGPEVYQQAGDTLGLWKLHYLGESCPDLDLGIFNWMW